ncbi:MAG: B12-binding domain-containing radical SAM protein [Xanthobacteraceae bacterium]
MRSPVQVSNKRRILCIFPAYTPAFGTFAHAFPLLYNVSAFMPPQGLLLIAAYLPERWQVRFVDENMGQASASDFAWADVVMASGMHVQAPQIRDIHERAMAAGKVMVLGGPSVSAAPEMYPDIDYLHIGEIGDSTDALIARLDRDVSPPRQQVRFETKERLPLTEFPIPAYDAVTLGRYLIGSLQFSSGCPYQCEFCDIPVLYGRQPRIKSPEQLLAELDVMLAQPARPSTIYFVDDNFIGNKKAARGILYHLVAWQKRNSYPFTFACEATLNIAKQTDVLAMMREAAFVTVFVGIETPDLHALKSMHKEQNASLPMLEAIATLNSYGLEVTSGIILGLDTDTDESADRLIEFIEQSQIPILTINLLQALPKTPLWARLARDQRIVDDPNLESNVRFQRPYMKVLADWRRCIAHAYTPEKLFARFRHQVDATYVNRIRPPARGRLTLANLRMGAVSIFRIITRVGIISPYRHAFWSAAGYALRRGQIDAALGMGFVAHHLIRFTQEALRGEQNASFYSTHERDTNRITVAMHAHATFPRSNAREMSDAGV